VAIVNDTERNGLVIEFELGQVGDLRATDVDNPRLGRVGVLLNKRDSCVLQVVKNMK
jgi:hypothetical protein